MEKIKPPGFRDSPLFYDFISSLTDPIYIVNNQKKIIFANPQLEAITGMSLKKFINKNCDEIIHPVNRNCAYDCPIKKVIDEDKIETFNGKIYLVNKIFSFKAVAFPLKIKDEPFKILVLIKEKDQDDIKIKDIDLLEKKLKEYKRIENALRESEAKHRILIENIPFSVKLVEVRLKPDKSVKTKLLHINKKGASIIGGKDKDLIGEEVINWFSLKNQEIISNVIIDSIHNKKMAESEFFGTIRGIEEKWWSVKSLFLEKLSEDLYRIIMIISDISDHKRYEEEQYYLQERIAFSQKMEAITQLASGIARDFNKLLGSIIGYTSAAKRNIKDAKISSITLDLIENSAIKAIELIRELMDFAKKETYFAESISINNIIRRCLSLFHPSYDTTITIETNLEENLWNIEGNETQLTQAFLNICINAQEAMPKGGKIIIKTKNLFFNKDNDENLNTPSPGDFILISIKDEGIGIPDEVKKRIFDPFFTTKHRNKHHGMGLAVAYGIIKSHGGYITVESEKGKGSCFRIYFPAIPLKSEKYTLDQAKDLKEKRAILFVDDEEIILEIGEKMLKRLGYHIYLATNGEEAIKVFKEHIGEINLIILDVIMPGLSWKDTAHLIHQIDPNLPILLTSGFALKNHILDLESNGIEGFLQKPFTIYELEEKIREVLEDIE